MLRQCHDRQNIFVGQESQQLVHVGSQKPLFGHSVDVPTQTVDHNRLDSIAIHGVDDELREFARAELGAIDLLQADAAVLDVRVERQSEFSTSCGECSGGLIEHKKQNFL